MCRATGAASTSPKGAKVHSASNATGGMVTDGVWLVWDDWSQCTLQMGDGLFSICSAQSDDIPAPATMEAPGPGVDCGQAYADAASWPRASITAQMKANGRRAVRGDMQERVRDKAAKSQHAARVLVSESLVRDPRDRGLPALHDGHAVGGQIHLHMGAAVGFHHLCGVLGIEQVFHGAPRRAQ